MVIACYGKSVNQPAIQPELASSDRSGMKDIKVEHVSQGIFIIKFLCTKALSSLLRLSYHLPHRHRRSADSSSTLVRPSWLPDIPSAPHNPIKHIQITIPLSCHFPLSLPHLNPVLRDHQSARRKKVHVQ